MTTHTGTIRSAEDLLAWIPHGLGHWPSESLVVLGHQGRNTGGLLRLDLPSPCPAAAGGDVGRYVYDIFARTGTTGVFLVVYGADLVGDGRAAPQGRAVPGAFLHRLARLLDRRGLRVHDCLYVTGGGWGHVDVNAPGGRCSPAQPLTGITDSVLNTELVFAGHAWGNETEVLPPRAGGPESETVRRWAAVHQPAGAADPPADAWARRVVAVWERELTARPVGVGADTAGLLLAGLRSRTVRDLLLFQAAAGPSETITDLVLAAAGCPVTPASTTPATPTTPTTPATPATPTTPATPVGTTTSAPTGGEWPSAAPTPGPAADVREGGLSLLSSVIVGSPVDGLSVTPNWQRLDAAHTLLSQIAPHGEGDARSAALTVLGWIEFARGRGSRAHTYLSAVLAEDARYELARLFERFLDLGQVHAWARSRETAWTRGGHDAV